MKKKRSMGKWLLIFGITALVSAFAFVISVAALGVRDNNWQVNIGGWNAMNITDNTDRRIIFTESGYDTSEYAAPNTEYTHTFDSASDLRDIKLGLASCKAAVNCTDSGTVSVKYTTGSIPSAFTAELTNGRLIITEKVRGFSLFSFGGQGSTLELTLPKRVYDSFGIDLASGGVTAKDMTCGELSANVASGSIDMDISARDIDINTASGKVVLTNISDTPAESIEINIASGTNELHGFGSKAANVKIASGKAILDGISGNVTAEIMSGSAQLIYSDWNGDLSVEQASGSCDVTLPEGSGADIRFDGHSGGLKAELDGDSSSFSHKESGIVGGKNVHRITVEAASGSTRIHN